MSLSAIRSGAAITARTMGWSAGRFRPRGGRVLSRLSVSARQKAERRNGTTLDILARQLAGSLPDGAQANNTIIAYEPVWAIGTGLTPSTGDVGEAHAFIRGVLGDRFGAEGTAMKILYGGSVKPSNAHELLAVDEVNGALVGGASLKAEDFLAICDTYQDRPS